MSKRQALWTVAWLLLFVLSGCGTSRTHTEVTLNPDGSCKVFELKETKTEISAKNTEQPPEPTAQPACTTQPVRSRAQEQALAWARDANGVAAVTDVSYGVAEDGADRVSGVRYYADYSTARSPIGIGADVLAALRPIWRPHPDGGMVLEFASTEPAATQPTTQPATKLSDREVLKKVAEMRKAFREQIADREEEIAMLNRAFSTVWVCHLPGRIAEVRGFKKVDENTVGFTLCYEQLVRAGQRLIEDDAYMIGAVRSGLGSEEIVSGLPLFKALFGGQMPYVRVVGKFEPQFDFEKEVAAAQRAYPGMIRRLQRAPRRPTSAPASKR